MKSKKEIRNSLQSSIKFSSSGKFNTPKSSFQCYFHTFLIFTILEQNEILLYHFLNKCKVYTFQQLFQVWSIRSKQAIWCDANYGTGNLNYLFNTGFVRSNIWDGLPCYVFGHFVCQNIKQKGWLILTPFVYLINMIEMSLLFLTLVWHKHVLFKAVNFLVLMYVGVSLDLGTVNTKMLCSMLLIYQVVLLYPWILVQLTPKCCVLGCWYTRCCCIPGSWYS